ncbi:MULTISPECIES: type IV secretion system protein [unclassified Ochrobactrum]|jgi:type IV secretion system protein VirB6|uniref:type IV secretion system protein n=1 Tax=unclassified Ochrobactrum TaxID=239106 RepID=UPI000DEFD7DD|nr:MULTISPECIES: type IV secretion system protein [unclassified Ochrobactrum]MBQ0707902.1 type IV secretion system protein [Ochrobactrum sp. AP1BH01-1]
MSDFLGDILVRVDQTGATFSNQAYSIISNQISPLLNVLLIAYVIYYGLQLIMGTSQITVATVVGRLIRMIVIFVLIRNWGYVNNSIYSWLNETPKELGTTLLNILGTNVNNVTAGLSLIWKCANLAADAYAQKSGYLAVLPSLVGLLLLTGALSFIGLALSILLLAKVVTWILIGTAPIFIACMLFEQSRGIGRAWFQQLLLYAMLPLFLYVICAFLLEAIDPDLNRLLNADSTTITLIDMRGFVLLCAASAFVVANIHALARGIASGLTVGISRFTRKIEHIPGFGTSPQIARTGTANSPYLGRGSRFYRDSRSYISPIRRGEMEAMQNRIRNNSLPQ